MGAETKPEQEQEGTASAALPGAPRPAEPEATSPPPSTATDEPQAGSSSGSGGGGGSSSEPALPPRDYSHDPRWLRYQPPPPPLPRDRTLARFFRFMASLLFYGGSAAGLAVLFYRRVVLPRLAVLASRMTALHTHHLTHYSRFVDAIRTLAIRTAILCPQTAILAAAVQTPLPADAVQDEAVQTGPPPLTSEKEEATVDLLQPLSQTSSRPPSRTSQASAPGVPGPERGTQTLLEKEEAVVPVAADLSAGLRSSLKALTAEVEASTSTTEEDDVSPPKRLVDSLETLSSYISTQSFYATQQKLNMAGGGYSFGQVQPPPAAAAQLHSSPAAEAASQCRSEIRGLKGLLLNRRNFALLDRAWDEEGAAA